MIRIMAKPLLCVLDGFLFTSHCHAKGALSHQHLHLEMLDEQRSDMHSLGARVSLILIVNSDAARRSFTSG